MSRSLNHIHTLIKMDKKHRKCKDPLCFFTCTNELAKGKATLCGICGIKEMVMNSIQMKLSVPRCDNCSNRRDAREGRTLVQNLERLGL